MEKKTTKKNILMHQMWSEFIREHPHLKTTSLKNKTNGPVISLSTLRNIFNGELKDALSFRKLRVDTCQECEKFNNRLDNLRSLNNQSSKQDDKMRDLLTHRSLHLREREVRFASLRYDVTVLAAKVFECSEIAQMRSLLEFTK